LSIKKNLQGYKAQSPKEEILEQNPLSMQELQQTASLGYYNMLFPGFMKSCSSF